MANGTYIIPVWDTITASWEKVHGAKKTIWAALVIFFAIMFCLGFLDGFFNESSSALSFVIQIVANLVGYFMQMGVLYIGIKRAYDLPIEYKQLFRVFESDIAAKMVTLYILQILIFIPVIMALVAISVATSYFPAIPAILPIILFVLGGLAIAYLSVRMLISNALVLDKATAPLDAIKLSFRATRGNVWPCLGLIVLQVIMIGISAIPFGIGLIWALPLTFICYGVTYKRLSVNCQ